MQDLIKTAKTESQKQLEDFCEDLYQKSSHNEAREILHDTELTSRVVLFDQASRLTKGFFLPSRTDY